MNSDDDSVFEDESTLAMGEEKRRG